MHNVDQSWSSYNLKLKNLTPDQVRQIDAYLSSIGDYGEVSLVVENGELRYVNTLTSFRAVPMMTGGNNGRRAPSSFGGQISRNENEGPGFGEDETIPGSRR